MLNSGWGTLNSRVNQSLRVRATEACAIIVRRPLSQATDSKDGEMSEWFKEHAWKSDLFTHSDAQQHPPTHSRSTTSRNIDTRRHVLVNHRVDRGFRGVCDTVLTQSSRQFMATNIYAHRFISNLRDVKPASSQSRDSQESCKDKVAPNRTRLNSRVENAPRA